MNQVKYKFYPSLLDKFQSFVDMSAEDYFYQDENGVWHKNYNEATGEYHYSESEVYDLAKQELINAINRVRSTSEAASKGTAFNELVDVLIHNKKSEVIDTKKIYKDINGNILRSEMPLNPKIFKLIGVETKLEGFTFWFDINLIKEASEYLKGSLSQVLTSATIDTAYGKVELYGYIDELNKDKVYDLKTTKKYEFGKYSKYWQRHVYPYCLIESGECTNIDSFEFTCYQLKDGEKTELRGETYRMIEGKKYPELYNYNHEQSKSLLKAQCERFIEFLEENKELITDKKVFGGEKE